jgi:sulfatase modifying factor 1
MNETKKCPVCDTDLGNTIPDFCPICGWECGTDISLIPSLTRPSDGDLEYYRKKLGLAREVWSKSQSQSQEQAKRLGDKDREIEALRKQLEEKDKDKAVAEKKAAEAQDQIKALGKDKASLEIELDEAKKRISDLEADRRQNQVRIITPPKLFDAYPEMVLVEGGSFLMGTQDGKHLHKVELSSFYIGKYPVTQKQWCKLMGSSLELGFGMGDYYPMYQISWYDTIKFCNLLSLAEGLKPCYTINGSADPTNWGDVPIRSNKVWDAVTCDWEANGYRLSTEAEWEYTARGGRESRGYKYSGSDNIDDVAWYTNNSDDIIHPVGKKKANELGIYDMSGNVCEWCWDWYGDYDPAFQTNPTGPVTGKYRLLRGGGWYSYAVNCHVFYRSYFNPSSSVYNYGFRLCRSAV